MQEAVGSARLALGDETGRWVRVSRWKNPKGYKHITTMCIVGSLLRTRQE